MNCRRSGAALVIVLAFLVLLTALAVAFFSRTITERQVSNSSMNQVKAEIFARSALDMIVGDVKQEIVNGSATPSPTPPPGTNIYNPKSSAYVVPQRSGTAIPNLIRFSLRNDPLSSGSVVAVSASASAVNSTSDLSANGRSVNLTRWNLHYLIPTTSGSTNMPVPAFTAPDWVMVTKNGPQVVTTPTNTVIGRFAYAIYDEGGLLDANVAGCPSNLALSASQGGLKGFSALADLTALGLTTQQEDTFVGWRNYATSQLSSGSLATGYTFDSTAANFYYNYVIGSTNGFLSVNNYNYTISSGTLTSSTMNFGSPAHTDQVFPNRQALIKFWGTNFGGNMNALQYLGTFTRDLNRPNFSPRAYPPPAGGLMPAPVTYSGAVTDPNPIIQNVLYTNPSSTNYGQPVLAQRFPLSRLALFSDPVNNAAAILNYFGLSRTVGGTKDGYTWNYIGHPPSITNTVPMTLGQIAALATPRDPDFFEVLQAAVLNGSLGVPATTNGNNPNILAKTIMQIGADIIDQYKADSIPTAISFTGKIGAISQTNTVWGMQNLPYFSEMMLWTYRPQSDVDRFTLNGYLLIELWNPHQNAVNITSSGSPAPFVPSKLRVCFDARGGYILLNHSPLDSHCLFSPLLPTGPSSESPNGTVQVTFSHSTRFQEPTVLDSALVDQANSSSTQNATTAGWETLSESGTSRSGFLIGTGAFPDNILSLSLGIATSGTYHYTKAEFTGGSNPHIHLQFLDNNNVWRDYQGGYSSLNEPPSLTMNTIQGEVIGTVNACSPFNSQITNDISFNTFDYICGKSLQQEDPRGTAAGNPFSADSTYNKSIRPGSGATGFNPAGAKLGRYGIGASPSNLASYILPTSPDTLAWTPTPCYPAMYNENVTGTNNIFIKANPTAVNSYVRDMDGVLRPGDGYYGADPYLTGSLSGRPVILNRPFRSVGEMGYAYRGRSWKSVNFFSPESGDAGLLDFFSIDQAPVASGKINLNTHQVVSLQAMLQGACRVVPAGTVSSASEALSSADAAAVANAIVAHTTQQPGSKTYPVGPLASRADLVRDLLADPTLAALPGTTPTGVIDTIGTTSNTIKSKREAFVRALADVGTTRTWNLLIDIVAQTGNYPVNATSLSQFMVQGEKHYWLHVAIDRCTGEIIDQQLESVNE